MPLLGDYLTSIERMYFDEFKRGFDEVKRYARLRVSRNVSVVGFIVKIEGNYRLIPFPTLIKLKKYSLCLKIPRNLRGKVREWSYVEVVGRPYLNYIWTGEFTFRVDYGVIVEDLTLLNYRAPRIRFEDYLNFIDSIFYGLRGVDFEVKKDIALVFISSPSLLGYAGGISHVVSSIDLSISRSISRMFRRIIPPNLRRISSSYPYPWRLLMDKRQVKFFDPARRRPRGFISEFSGSFSTGPLEEALKIAEGSKIELAFIFDEGVEILLDSFRDIYPEVIDFIAKMHFYHPTLPPNLEEIAYHKSLELADWISYLRHYDFNEALIRIINPSWYATPLSLIRLAVAYARSYGKREVTRDDIETAFNKIEDNIRSLEKISNEWNISLKLSFMGEKPTLMESKVLNAIEKLEKEFNEPPSKRQIMMKTGIKEIDLDNIITSLLRKGLIYEPKPERYMIIPL